MATHQANRLTREASDKLMFIAGKLPTVMELTIEYHFIPVDEAKEMYPDIEVKAIPKGPLAGKSRVPMPVRIAANHYRRLKKRFLTGGEPSVIEYIKEVQALKADC